MQIPSSVIVMHIASKQHSLGTIKIEEKHPSIGRNPVFFLIFFFLLEGLYLNAKES